MAPHPHLCGAFLPGVPLTLKTQRPKDYSEAPQTLGQHLKRRRKELEEVKSCPIRRSLTKSCPHHKMTQSGDLAEFVEILRLLQKCPGSGNLRTRITTSLAIRPSSIESSTAEMNRARQW
jgi:hypothetical protein